MSEGHEGAHLVDKGKAAAKVGDSKEGLMMGYGRIKPGDEYWGRYGHGPNKLPEEGRIPSFRETVDE